MTTRTYTIAATGSLPAQTVDASEWGALKAVCITRGEDFWALYQELVDDGSVFAANRITLVEAFRAGNLYGLEFDESQYSFDTNIHPWGRLFCQDDTAQVEYYLLPCLCVRNGDEAVIIWTHSRVRRNGFATELICQLGITRTMGRLKGSEAFWSSIEKSVWKSPSQSGNA
jgi:hypothetical protein